MQISESKAQMVGGTILALFAVALYFIIIPAEIIFAQVRMGVSPRYFPNLLAGLLFIFAVALAVDGYRMRDHKKMKSYSVTAKDLRIVLFTLGVIALQIIGFDLIGYLVPAMLAIAVCMYMYGQRNYLLIVLVSVLLPLGIKYFFEQMLQVALP